MCIYFHATIQCTHPECIIINIIKNNFQKQKQDAIPFWDQEIENSTNYSFMQHQHQLTQSSSKEMKNNEKQRVLKRKKLNKKSKPTIYKTKNNKLKSFKLTNKQLFEKKQQNKLNSSNDK